MMVNICENGPDKARSEVRRQKLIIPMMMMMIVMMIVMMMVMMMVMTMTMIQLLYLKMGNDNEI